MQNAVSLSNPGSEALAKASRERAVDADERVAFNRRDVRRALGGRYERIGTAQQEGKPGELVGPRRLVYFSHENNATIEIVVENRAVRTLRTIPPAEYQPDISPAEKDAAEALARAHFQALGRERVAALRAFGILAYKPEGSGFFDTRVLYISFHPDADAAPEFAAWVDLTSQRVLRIREEQP